MLSQGLSTFMMEMRETAEILEKADDKSLIILDEIGRGTATFDGMSLAQSILEFLTTEKKPLLFSATHYQELTQLAKNYPSIKNASMDIREKEGSIHFLYLLKPGPANKSYGIQVARLAGLPPSVLNRAHQLLNEYESSPHASKKVPGVEKSSFPEKNLQKKNKDQLVISLIKEISQYPLMTQSPIDAMNQIQKWQKSIPSIVGEYPEKALKTKELSVFEQDVLPDILN